MRLHQQLAIFSQLAGHTVLVGRSLPSYEKMEGTNNKLRGCVRPSIMRFSGRIVCTPVILVTFCHNILRVLNVQGVFILLKYFTKEKRLETTGLETVLR